MGIEKSELLTMLEHFREVELKNVKSCQEKEEQLTSPGAKLVLYQIRMDSTKHAHIYQVLMDMIKEGTPEYLWDYIRDRYIGQLVAEKALQEHIEAENEMIEHCEEILKRTDDPGLKMVFRFIVEDEKMHSRLLEDVVKRLTKLGPQAK